MMSIFLRNDLAKFLVVGIFMNCAQLWAAQNAIVLVDKAIIYSDREMTSPVGYLRRGKKIVVGEISRNKGQVYPIVVSGKVAYVKVLDLSTEKESMDAQRLTAERFFKTTQKKYDSYVTANYLRSSTDLSLDQTNGDLSDGDVLVWNGVSLRGGVNFDSLWNVDIIINYLASDTSDEKFNFLETGFGAGFRLMEFRSFTLNLFTEALIIPFSTYSIGTQTRIKSYGGSIGAGASMSLRIVKETFFNAFYGVYNTQLLEFDMPAPYNDFKPSFIGTRLGAGLVWKF